MGASQEPDFGRRELLRLTGLNALAGVTVPLAGLADVAALGQLPDVRFLAGVALGSVIFDVVFGSLSFLRIATTARVAHSDGANDSVERTRAILRSASLAVLLAGVAVLASPLIERVGFALSSGTPEAQAAGRAYFWARIVGAPAALLNMTVLGALLGSGRSGAALVLTVSTNLLNIALNFVFILGLDLEATGAGAATAIAQWTSLGLGLFLLRPLLVRPWPRGVWDPSGLRELLTLNLTLFTRTLTLLVVFAVFTNLSGTFGDVRLGANTILVRCLLVGSFLIDGAATAGETFAGRAAGLRSAARLGRVVRDVLWLSLGLGVLFAVLFALFGPTVAQLLSERADVAAMAARDRFWLCAIVLPGAIAYGLDGIFMGLADARALRDAILVGALVFAGLAALAMAYDAPGLLFAALFAMVVVRAGWLSRALNRWFDGRRLPLGSESR